jgi:dipeptidyl aminopeptidase/acylaminoacyl peptidase
MQYITSSILWFVILFTILRGQNAPRQHEITIEDYFTQAYIECCVASPDGKHIAYIESRWDKQIDGRSYDLWIVNIQSKKVRRLTFDLAKKEYPQWSSDGQKIFFKSKSINATEEGSGNNESAQIWQIDLDGTGLMPLTSAPNGIQRYKIIGNAGAIFFTVTKAHIIDDWNELRNEFKDIIKFGHGIHKVSELWKLDLITWRLTKISDIPRYIRYFDVSPDGQRIAMITNPNEHLITHEGQSEVEVANVSTGQSEVLPDDLWRDQAPSPYGWLENPTWSDDGKILAFSIAFDGYPKEIFTAQWKGNKADIKKLSRPEDVEVQGTFHWLPGKRSLCFLGEHKALQHVYSINYENGTNQVHTPGDVVVDDYDFIDKNGSLIALQSTLTYHRDLVLYKSKSKTERITNVNPQVDNWKLPQISLIKWTGAQGDMAEGILELPPDYNREKKLPLIVQIHGGPTASEKFEFEFQIYGRTALAVRGYALFSPNYRGSTGYGDAFITELIGRENDIDVEDILKGVDYLIEQGIADPERLGVMGWSNGGFLTNCLIATNRFIAASSGAGVVDQTIQWGEEDTPGHVINYMQGLPWENPEAYQSGSPLYTFKPGIKTATLIHAGEKDARVPVNHSLVLHRALHHYINAPCELLIYPGAKHSLSTYRHRLAKMKWDHAWFDKYLKKDYIP